MRVSACVTFLAPTNPAKRASSPASARRCTEQKIQCLDETKPRAIFGKKWQSVLPEKKIHLQDCSNARTPSGWTQLIRSDALRPNLETSHILRFLRWIQLQPNPL